MQTEELFDETCGFCAEIHGIRSDNNLLEHYITPQTGLTSRVITQTEHFRVIPTIGAFVEGYVMVVSLEHYDCAGKIPAACYPELKQLLRDTKEIIRQKYGMETVCFEHGSVSCTNRFGGCINHAHIHVVPCRESLIGQLAEYQMEYRKIDSIDELQPYGQSGCPYLFFEDTDQQQYVITGDFIISQFFRQLLARSHGVPDEWDWRGHLHLENIGATCEKLGKAFEQKR